MRVICIKGAEGILTEGEIYTVINVTTKGNYILAELDPPSPHTSFDATRFQEVLEDDWTQEMEDQYWSEQPPYTFETEEDLKQLSEVL